MPVNPFLEPFLPFPLLPADIPDFAAFRAQASAGDEAMVASLIEPSPPGVDVRELKVAVDGGEVEVTIYRPDGADGPLPAHLYIHGGGWIAGDIFNTHVRATGGERSIGAHCVTFAVNYRKAPEFPYPTGLNDCYTVLEWMVENADALRIDPSRIAVGGGSAGGNLSAALCLKARDLGGPNIIFQLLEVPALDLTMSLPSHVDSDLGSRYGLNGADVPRMIEWYLQGQDPTDPYVSTLLAEDLTGLPPALIMSAEFDLLRDDGARYAERLREAGVPGEFFLGEGHIHHSIAFTGAMESARAWRQTAVDALRRALAGTASHSEH